MRLRFNLFPARWCFSLLVLLFSFSTYAQDGALDAAFSQAGGTGFVSDVTAVAVQPDGKIVAAGNFGTYNGVARRGVARLNSDGTLDASFVPEGTAFRGPNGFFQLGALALQPDGKILVGGSFVEFNGVPRNYLVRLNADGTLDASFVPAAAVNATVLTIVVQPDGKVLLGGGFYASAATRWVLRLNADGSLDTGFGISGTGLSSNSGAPGSGVHAIALQPDGKIFIGGEFTTYNGIPCSRVIRLNADGTRDASFALTGGGINGGNQYSEYFVEDMVLQPDGKLVAVGAFTAYNEIDRNHILRLNTDGTLDPTFLHAGGFNNNVNSIVRQPDGKFIAGGAFSSYNGTTRNRLARLNADGSLDAGFNLTGTGLNQYLYSVALQSDGKVLAGGASFTYNGATVSRLVRINNTVRTVLVGTLPGSSYFAGQTFTIPYTTYGSFTAGNTFSAQLSNAQGSFASPVVIGAVSSTTAGSIAATIPANTAAGSAYRIRIVSSTPAVTGPDNGSNLVVTGPPSATISYPGSPYCAVSGSIPVTFTGTEGGQFSAGNGLSVNSSTGALNLSASLPGTYTVTYTVGGFSTSTPVTIRPQAASLPNQEVCAGSTVPAPSLAVIPGLTWNWTNSAPSIGLAATGSGPLPAFVAVNGGSTAVNATVTVGATGGTGCALKLTGFRITVKPTPALQVPAGQTLCAGSATQPVAFTSTLPGTTVTWTNTAPGIGIPAAGGGNLPSFTAANNSGAQLLATVQAVPTAGGCSGSPVSFVYTINSSVQSIAYPGSPFCPSGNVPVTRAGSGGGRYTATPAGLDLDPNTGEIRLASSLPATYLVTYVVNGAAGCSSTATTTVTVLAQAGANAMPNQAYCSGVTAPATVFTGTAASYNWTNDNPSIGLAASGTGNLPAFTTVNAGPGAQYATIRVYPQGNNASSCSGKPMAFRITVNYCGPVAQSGGMNGDAATQRMVLSLSPNPVVGGTLRLSVAGPARRLTVEIRDGNGLALLRGMYLQGNSGSYDLSALRAGAYFVVVSDPASGAQSSLPFVKL